MTLNSCWRRSAAWVLIVIVGFGNAKTWAVQISNAENLRRLGLEAFDQGRYSEAERNLRLALEEFALGANSFETAQTLSDLAAVLAAEERFLEAEALLNRALQLMEGLGPHPRETARLLGNLGALYQGTGRNKAAETAFTQALHFLEQYDPENPRIVVLL